MSVELAKAYLQRTLSDPALGRKQPAALLIDVGKKTHGLTRKDLKQARNELGIASKVVDGSRYWERPEVWP